MNHKQTNSLFMLDVDHQTCSECVKYKPSKQAVSVSVNSPTSAICCYLQLYNKCRCYSMEVDAKCEIEH